MEWEVTFDFGKLLSYVNSVMLWLLRKVAVQLYAMENATPEIRYLLEEAPFPK